MVCQGADGRTRGVLDEDRGGCGWLQRPEPLDAGGATLPIGSPPLVGSGLHLIKQSIKYAAMPAKDTRTPSTKPPVSTGKGRKRTPGRPGARSPDLRERLLEVCERYLPPLEA